MMPPKNKAMACSGKKGKALKKKANPTPQPTSDSDWMSGGDGEEATIKDLSNMTTMMPSLNTRLEAIDGNGWKKRKVTFCGEAPATRTAGQWLRPSAGLPAPTARPEAPEMIMMENALPPLPTTSQPNYDQPPTLLGPFQERREPQLAAPLSMIYHRCPDR